MAQLMQSPTRPKRFSMHIPVKYRYSGSSEWHSGTTENISASGLLFRGRHKVQRFAPVEITLKLPQELVGVAPLTVMANGYIVRTTEPRFPMGRPGFAAALANFRLLDERMEAQFLQWLMTGAQHGVSPGFLHTMNNLLTVIMGNSELMLMDQGLAPEMRQRLENIKAAAESAGALLRTMAEPKGQA